MSLGFLTPAGHEISWNWDHDKMRIAAEEVPAWNLELEYLIDVYSQS